VNAYVNHLYSQYPLSPRHQHPDRRSDLPENYLRLGMSVCSMMTWGRYPLAFNIPMRGPRCLTVVDRLLKNFYRHPGTALYLKMVTGYDSYMHQSYEKL
jgi:hypothetical protein